MKRSREDDIDNTAVSVKDLPPTKKVMCIICNAAYDRSSLHSQTVFAFILRI